MQINALNSNRLSEPAKSFSEDVVEKNMRRAWLASIVVGLSKEIKLSLEQNFSWFHDPQKSILFFGGATLGFFIRRGSTLVSPKLVTAIAAINNFTNRYFFNGEFNYEFTGFTLGVILADYLAKRNQKINVKKAEQEQLTLISDKTIYAKLKNKLNEVVIGQTEAKDHLAKAVALHYERLNSSFSILGKSNILLIGPSGSGKTWMMETISKELGVPVATIDASRITPEGYIGAKFDDAFRQLYENSNKSIGLAEKGIIFIDEVDKLFKTSETEKNQFSLIQNQLLTILQGTKISFQTNSSLLFGDTQTIDTKNILFVMAGAFSELGHDQNKEKAQLENQDLLNFGFKPEFLGRIGHLIQLNPLTIADYRSLLLNKEGGMSFEAWKKEFEKIDLVLNFDDNLIDKIVDYAWNAGTGVRGLDFALKQLISPILIDCMEKRKSDQIQPGSNVIITLEDWLKTGLGQPKKIPTIGELKAILDRKMVGQEAAKDTVIQAIYFHYSKQLNQKGVVLPKGNVLLIGPSGTGKTMMIDVLSKELDLPLAMIDASRLTREGYVGPKIGDAIVSLLEQTKGNVAKAEKGIIFLDEIDKVFADSLNVKTAEVAGASIQHQLLSLLQGGDITVTYNSERKTVNTKNIMFIMAGAFSPLTAAARPVSIDDQVLLKAGIMPEFLGRIGYIARLYPLSLEEMKKTLTLGPEAPLTGWFNMFDSHGARLILSEKSEKALIENARKKATGVRGLHFELQKLLAPHLAKTIAHKASQQDPSKLLLVVV